MGKKLTTEEFISKAVLLHKGIYNYTKAIYTNNRARITIICPVHGEFKQLAKNHLKHGCSKCARTTVAKRNILTATEFSDTASIKHLNKYDYSKVKYVNYRTKVEIICPLHGSFWQTPEAHNGSQLQGCPRCCSSKGEQEVRVWLQQRSVYFKEQYRFTNCRGLKYPLPFDFAIFNEDGSLRCLIEYQGKQHFCNKNSWLTEEEFKALQYRDAIKRKYCTKNNLRLIEISYKDDVYSILAKIQ